MESSPPLTTSVAPVEIHKFAAIDALRGLAVIGVIIVHAAGSFPVSIPWLQNILDSGRYGVQLFFIVSAFTMMHSWNSRREEPNKVRNFFIRRYFRIAPMFYVGVGLYTVFYFLTAKSKFTWWEYLSTITFTHGFVPPAINKVVSGGWSIAVEFTFYALFPLLASVVTSQSRALVMAASGIAVSVACYLFLPAFGYARPEYSFFEYWFPNHFYVFGLGFILYYALHSKNDWMPEKYMGSALLATTALLFLAGALRSHSVLGHLSFTPLFVVLCYLVYKTRTPILVNKVLTHIGVNSFSIYIWQYAVIAACARILKSVVPDLSVYVALPVLIVFALGISDLLAEISKVWIEDPGQRIGKNLIKKWSSAKSAAQTGAAAG